MNEISKWLHENERSVAWLSRQTGIPEHRLYRLNNYDDLRSYMLLKELDAMRTIPALYSSLVEHDHE